MMENYQRIDQAIATTALLEYTAETVRSTLSQCINAINTIEDATDPNGKITHIFNEAILQKYYLQRTYLVKRLGLGSIPQILDMCNNPDPTELITFFFKMLEEPDTSTIPFNKENSLRAIDEIILAIYRPTSKLSDQFK